MNKNDLIKFKKEAKLAYSNWLKEITIGSKKVYLSAENEKEEWLKEYPSYSIKLDIYEKEDMKDKYFLVPITCETDFIDIHKHVRARINPSKIDDWRSVYVNYVVKDEKKAKDLVEKLVNIQEPKSTTYDYVENSIMYHIYIIKDQELVRMH